MRPAIEASAGKIRGFLASFAKLVRSGAKYM